MQLFKITGDHLAAAPINILFKKINAEIRTEADKKT